MQQNPDSLTQDLMDEPIRRFAGYARNIIPMLNWCRLNPEVYASIEMAFIQVIARTNEILQQPENPKFFAINRLRGFLDTQILPNINELVEGNTNLNIFSLGKALVDMGGEMTTGEAIVDSGIQTTEPFLKFHTVDRGHKARLCGAFFHFYDTLVRRIFPQVPRELICDAVLEALSILGPENVIFDELANPGKLNWILTGPGIFSDELLAEVNQYYPDYTIVR